jgi:hypothetical protein
VWQWIPHNGRDHASIRLSVVRVDVNQPYVARDFGSREATTTTDVLTSPPPAADLPPRSARSERTRTTELAAREAPVVRVGERFEVAFDVPNLRRHPDDVTIRATFTSPAGKKITVGGFADGDRFKVRFSPTEPGRWSYTIRADGGTRERVVKVGALVGAAAPAAGYVRVDGEHPRRFIDDSGKTFHPLGENRINIYDKTWNYQQMNIPDYVAYMAKNGMNTLRVFVFTDAVPHDNPGGVQPGCLEPKLGRFDQNVAKDFDAIVEAAEKHGIKVIVTAFACGFTPNDVWKGWDDNPYNRKNGGPVEHHYDFFFDDAAKAAAKRRIDYIMDRWGYSPALFGIDVLNEPEWDGAIPEGVWIPWAREIAEYIQKKDPYDHPVTAGSVGLHWNVPNDEPPEYKNERPWYRSDANDYVQWHSYGADTYDPHDRVAVMARKVKETWRYEKPIMCGEFAYGGEDQKTFDHTLVGIWSAIMSGAGVLAHSAPPFNIDCDELMVPERAHHFRVLRDFLDGLDLTKPHAPMPESAKLEEPRGATLFTYGVPDQRALWIMAPKRGYGEEVQARITINELPPGDYRVEWINDSTGEKIAEAMLATEGSLTLEAPAFKRHIAARISRVD